MNEYDHIIEMLDDLGNRIVNLEHVLLQVVYYLNPGEEE